MNYILRYSITVLSTLVLLGVFGCGDSASPQKETTSGTNSQPDAAGGRSSAAGQAATNELPEKPTGSQQTLEAVGSSAQASETVNPAAVPEVEEIIQAAQQPPSTVAAAVPEPSAQQLAEWKIQEFEPLQLIDSVQFSEMGFTQRIVAIPNKPQYLLGGSTITLWTMGSSKPDHFFADWRNEENVEFRDVAVAPSGDWFVGTNSSGTLVVFDIATRKVLASKELNSPMLPSISISPDSTCIATANYNSQVTIWSADELLELNQFKIDSPGLKQILWVSPDRLVTASEGLAVWNTKDGTKLQTIDGDRYYASLSLSPNGQLMSHGDAEGLRICRTSDFVVAAHLPGNVALDELVIWLDDTRLASISGNLIRIWDVPSNRQIQAIDNLGSELAGACWFAESKVLAIASLLRRTRFWATATDAASLDKAPIQAEITYTDPPSPEPATVLQYANIIDLRSFPRLPDAVPQLEMANMLRYNTASTVEAATLFCRYTLHQKGWLELPSANGAYGSLTFIKNGFRLDCSIMEVPGMGSTISLTSLGNYDLQTAPKLKPLVQTTYESPSTCIFTSKSDIVTLETALLKAMIADGWVPYTRLASSHSENVDQRDLSFLQNSLELRVTITKNVSEPGVFNIQYSAFPVANSIPIPSGCTYIEFNGSPELQFVGSTKQSIQELIDFFDASMKEQGWVVQESDRSLEKDRVWLSYSRDQRDINIGLFQLEGGWNRILVGDVSASGSFQLAETPEADQPGDNQSGIEAADLPIVETAQNIQFQKLEKVVSFDVPDLPLDRLIKFYEEKLAAVGWTKKDRSMVEAEFCYADFAKGQDEITVRGNFRGGVASCNIQGDGLLWTKPLPGPQVSISYETWLRTKKNLASLEYLDEYESEMRAIQATAKPN